MGEAKRREEARLRGVLAAVESRKNRFETRLENQIWETEVAFDYYSKMSSRDTRLIDARAKMPLLADVWIRMIAFAELVKKGVVLQADAAKFWREYWEHDLVKVLGQIDIRLEECYFFLTRIKGATYKAVEFLSLDLGPDCDPRFLQKACSQALPIGELTLEIGLHFYNNNVIYWGENLLLNKGTDSASEKGELMISVRHSSNCWNCYPSPDNSRVLLSDYKQAKLALAQYPRSIRGELVHNQSGKLAELLGMKVVGKYAYLIR